MPSHAAESSYVIRTLSSKLVIFYRGFRKLFSTALPPWEANHHQQSREPEQSESKKGRLRQVVNDRGHKHGDTYQLKRSPCIATGESEAVRSYGYRKHNQTAYAAIQVDVQVPAMRIWDWPVDRL
jgi:hypothetical protein